jgi:PAS domain S-box-containing protein
VPAGRESQPGYTLASAEPVVVTDFGADARFGDSGFLADHGVESGVSVVVGSEAEPWGVLGAYATGRRGFTDDDVTFVQNVANVLGGAIDNHRAEAQLRKSEARFREMAELSPDGLFRADTDGTFTYLSPAAGTLLGRPVDELVGEGFHRLVAESSYADAIDGFGRVLGGEVVRGLTLTVLDDDGEPFDVEVSASPVRRDGEVVMVQGIARDITERRRAERELQRSRERYRTLVENFPNGGVFLFDDDLRYTAAGGRELDAVGVSADDVTGKTPAELFPPENAALLESNYRAALAGEPRSFEDEFQGRRYRIRIVPIRNADGAVVSGMAVSQNVTDRRTRERKLDRLRQRARRLTYTETVTETARAATDAANDVIGAPLSGFHALSDAGDALEPVVMADAVDDVFETVPSYPRDEEPGSRAALVWDAFERGEPLLIDDTSAYEPLTEPTPAGTALVHPVGDHGVFVVSAAEPNAYDETDKSLVEILTNSLTAALDRVEREQRLRDRERLLERQNERLDEFASIVSHDLRNPLNVAQGRLALVYEDCESDHLDAVATAHGRMSALIDDLLTLAREGETAGDASVVDLATVVESSWQHVETPGATLVCDADRRVRASQSRLQQLLENLFRNAVEHGSAGVTVTVDDLDDGFSVADDGPGIPPEDRERVFEPGYSTDDAGTGFGLAIVSAVVAEHGWDLDVTTSADGGARFAITGVERE